MKLNMLIVPATFALSIAAGISNLAAADSITGEVTAVPAADVLTVTHDGISENIRLFGADTPEPGQPFADDALKTVTALALKKKVTVDLVSTDSTGMKVGMVILPDYMNLNYTLVEKGLAWWDEPNAAEDRALKKLNAQAISTKAGLWASGAALSPWDFRRSHNMPAYSYGAPSTPEPPKEALKPAKPETKTISLKGHEEYKPTEAMANAGDLKDEGKKVDYMDLIAKHKPEIAKDASGKPLGLTATDVGSIPYAAQLGFKDGDIVSSVNGVPVTSLADIYGMVNQFKGAKSLNVAVIRGGAPTNITVKIP